jgi:hypothetical protein
MCSRFFKRYLIFIFIFIIFIGHTLGNVVSAETTRR